MMKKSKFTKEMNANIASPEVLPYLMSPFSRKRISETSILNLPFEKNIINRDLKDDKSPSSFQAIPEEYKWPAKNPTQKRIKLNHSVSLPMKFRSFEIIPQACSNDPVKEDLVGGEIQNSKSTPSLEDKVKFLSSDNSVYEAHELIGRGNQSKVLKVKERKSGQEFAAKINMKCMQSEEKLHLDEEFKILSMEINNSSIIKAYEIFSPKESPDDYILILEYFPGSTLRDAIENNLLTNDKEKIKIIKLVVEGINAIHTAGISHRDLSLDNILVSENKDKIKIIDFGLAKSFKNQAKEELKINEMPSEMMTAIGLTNYRAPEVIKGDFYTEKIDTWMCGLLLLQMFLSNTKITTKKVIKEKALMESIDNQNIRKLLGFMLVEDPSKRASIDFINKLLQQF